MAFEIVSDLGYHECHDEKLNPHRECVWTDFVCHVSVAAHLWAELHLDIDTICDLNFGQVNPWVPTLLVQCGMNRYLVCRAVPRPLYINRKPEFLQQHELVGLTPLCHDHSRVLSKTGTA